jgi:pimeloyl-ACP methyl ester carboxylesterase
MTARFDKATGRYVHLDILGTEHRVYFEEAGEGIPLLMQHTAGAHGAQWRHVLEDDWVTSHFRCLAYDLPYHGKSLPPTGPKWWTEPYDLTTEFAMAVPLALREALGADDPIFMGCSIGGLLALDLARYHAKEFRAVIGVEPSLRVGGSRRSMAGFWHPKVSNDFKASAMYGLMAPQSPEELRRETVFVYSQGWPPAFIGDLHFYVEDHDLRVEAANIDTDQVGVHLLTGEYDYSATPEHGLAAHQAITGSTFEVMEEMGHFPMSENPERFLDHLRPILENILADSRPV